MRKCAQLGRQRRRSASKINHEKTARRGALPETSDQEADTLENPRVGRGLYNRRVRRFLNRCLAWKEADGCPVGWKSRIPGVVPGSFKADVRFRHYWDQHSVGLALDLSEFVKPNPRAERRVEMVDARRRAKVEREMVKARRRELMLWRQQILATVGPKSPQYREVQRQIQELGNRCAQTRQSAQRPKRTQKKKSRATKFYTRKRSQRPSHKQLQLQKQVSMRDRAIAAAEKDKKFQKEPGDVRPGTTNEVVRLKQHAQPPSTPRVGLRHHKERVAG